MRLFFAVWPPPATAHALGKWAREVQAAAGSRATPEAAIHLTLAFLGEADPGRAASAARHVAGRAHALPVEQAQYWKHRRIVWAGPREMPAALATLAGALRGELEDCGFALEKREFLAHVTLLRNVRECGALPALPQLGWPVGEFLLVRSRTSPQGSRYEPIERFALFA